MHMYMYMCIFLHTHTYPHLKPAETPYTKNRWAPALLIRWYLYGVASISQIHRIVGLFCKRAI